ncbi:hypothetical protein BRC82_07430 [Halobacteriales archaeon QS_1_67_19]|nr:MAG: hypothetical protein BRC82_07430 [Halobacteriales archaeon QS_1_67_19]
MSRGMGFLLLIAVSYLLTQQLSADSINPRFLTVLLIVGWSLAYIGVLHLAGRTTLRQIRLLDEFYQVRRPLWYAIATLLGAGLHYLLFTYSPTVWALLFLSSVPVLLIGSKLLSSEGKIDEETRTLTYQGNEVDLELVTDVRRFTVGNRTFLWLSYTRDGVGIQSPRLLVLPTQLVDSAWQVFESGVAQEVESSETRRGTRGVFLATALGFLGSAVAIGVLVTRSEGLVVAIGFSGIFALFGLLFLWLAIFDV